MLGFIDRVDWVDDETIEIIDYKTNHQLFPREDLDSGLQLSLYQLIQLADGSVLPVAHLPEGPAEHGHHYVESALSSADFAVNAVARDYSRLTCGELRSPLTAPMFISQPQDPQRILNVQVYG